VVTAIVRRELLAEHRLALRPHSVDGWDLVLYAEPSSRAA
jgi:hypothetical protein